MSETSVDPYVLYYLMFAVMLFHQLSASGSPQNADLTEIFTKSSSSGRDFLLKINGMLFQLVNFDEHQAPPAPPHHVPRRPRKYTRKSNFTVKQTSRIKAVEKSVKELGIGRPIAPPALPFCRCCLFLLKARPTATLLLPTPEIAMSENPGRQSGAQVFCPLFISSILLLAFLLRLWKASGTFLNLDEAMHFLAANRPSLSEAYRASLGLAHPPLLILLLNVWRRLGTSELVLRLPSVFAGTIFCWILFKWLTRLLGPVSGYVGLILVAFLPPFVELSSEIRQYALLLCFSMAAAYVLELALDEISTGKMVMFFVLLYLAMLTHFSALLFTGTVAVYSAWRLTGLRAGHHLIGTWIAGQVGCAGLFTYLYLTHITNLKNSTAAKHMGVLLGNSYFHPARDHLVPFVFARTFGVFQYTFGQLAIGDIAAIMFLGGIGLLLRGKEIERLKIEDDGIHLSRRLAVFLILPFVITCVAAIADLYPYGGTRHSAFMIPFAVTGVSLAIAKLTRQRLVTLLPPDFSVVVCQIFGAPHRPYMHREDQRRANMTQAIDAIRRQVSPGGTIFVDFQTNFLLRFYLCPDAGPGVFSASGFRNTPATLITSFRQVPIPAF